MLEEQLRETFAAKAGSAPPGPLASLDGVADAAIRGAARIRRRRRAAASGLAGFVAFAAVSVAVLHTLSSGGPIGDPQADGPAHNPSDRNTTWSSGPVQPSNPAPMREVEAIKPSAQAATKVRLQLPDKDAVVAAYQAKDGYLVVNTQPDGDKQLVLQQDDGDDQEVLVDQASNITVAKNGGTVAWASDGQMNVGTRKADGNANMITKNNQAPVPQNTEPVAFVGTVLVMSNADQGYDVWHTERGYSPTWVKNVLRVFGGTQDSSGVYAEIAAVAPDTSMCLAVLLFDQPFKTQKKVCGLPMAAKTGGRISPDGRWLAYPVDGNKQVAMVDLTTVFTDSKPKPRTWNLTVTSKTVWLNAKTFVVDNGKKFLKLDPTGKAEQYEPLDQESDGVVLIEPLASE